MTARTPNNVKRKDAIRGTGRKYSLSCAVEAVEIASSKSSVLSWRLNVNKDDADVRPKRQAVPGPRGCLIEGAVANSTVDDDEN